MTIKTYHADEGGLHFLYENSAITFVGVYHEDVDEVVEWVSSHVTFNSDEVKVALFEGEVVNRVYHLTGSNAYPNDLSFISISLDQLESLDNLPKARLTIRDCMWFDDLIDNSVRREREGGVQ